MAEELWTVAALVTSWLNTSLNSNFITALAGAFAGAYAAQFIVERSARKRHLLEEIRNTNVAIIDTCTIVNVVCTLKAQLIGPLMAEYSKQREMHKTFFSSTDHAYSRSPRLYHFDVNFQLLPHIRVTVTGLQTFLFDKISISGRSSPLMRFLSLSIDEANTAIRARNEMIALYKSQAPIPGDDLASIYFGLPNKDGHVDTGYPDTMKAISEKIDDCIFFSKTLAEDLITHGVQISKEFGRGSPKIHKVAFTEAEQAGLIPDPALYEQWLRRHNF